MLQVADKLAVASDADPSASESARRVVRAFDTPPSQRPLPPGFNAASPLNDSQIDALYGPRFRGGWVAVFERSGWDAPPGGTGPTTKTVLERIHFLVGGDLVDEKALLVALRAVSTVAPDRTRPTPYLAWHMVDRDALWRAGVVPIAPAQVPQKPTVVVGDANRAL